MATTEAIAKILPMFGVQSLKDKQKIILDCLIEGKDCMAVLPTGFGKSLPFQMYLPVLREMKMPNPVTQKILVCCPLVSLMQDQVAKLADIPNVTAAFKGSSTLSDEKIKDGLTDIVFASPETLVGDPVWRSHLQKLDVAVLVIDEFHTIATWGDDDEETHKQAFRKWFSCVGELRSMFPNATVLALSATCTNKIRKRVKKVMQLKEDTVEVYLSPNKTNIKISVSKLNNNIEMGMSWIIDSLKEEKEHFPKLLIYCNSITDTSKLYTYIINELPECVLLVEMFHSETPKVKKDKIIAELQNENATVRKVICTSALGMGIDVKLCNSVILYGPPKNAVELIQEIGRIGRDGNPSIALILYTSNHLRQISSEVKEILKTNECRRVVLLRQFLNMQDLKNLEKEEGGIHTCCDLCTIKCKCYCCTVLAIEKFFSTTTSDDDISDDATEDYNLSDYEVEMAMLQIDE